MTCHVVPASLSLLVVSVAWAQVPGAQAGKPLPAVWENITAKLWKQIPGYQHDPNWYNRRVGTVHVDNTNGDLYVMLCAKWGTWKSSDQGETWAQADATALGRQVEDRGVCPNPVTGDFVLFKVNGGPPTQGAIALDHGKRWLPVPSGIGDGFRCGMADWGQSPPRMLLAIRHHHDGLYLSEDAGKSWKELPRNGGYGAAMLDANTIFLGFLDEATARKVSKWQAKFLPKDIMLTTDQCKTLTKVGRFSPRSETPTRYGNDLFWIAAEGVIYTFEGGGYMNVRLALEAVEETFVTDADRWYWEGGSWGSSVQIAMAAIWPDRFAGMSPNLMRYWATFFSGFGGRSMEKDLPLCGLGAERNAAQAFMFNGQKNDMGVADLARRQAQFRAAKPVWPDGFQRDEKRGLTYYHSPDRRFQINAVDETHEYVSGKKKVFGVHGLSAWQSRAIWQWFKTIRRTRPKEFFYIKISQAGDGVWGVHVKDNPAFDAWDPQTWERFECKVEGSTVRIDSHNTPGVTVELGRTARGRSLELTGEVTVIWNGKQAYAGPARTIELRP